MNEVAGGGGGDETDGEPDADAADRSVNDGEENEELGVRFEPVEQSVIVVLEGLLFGEDKEKSAADGEVGDEHVKSGYQRDEQTSAKGYVPDGVIHDASSRLYCARCWKERTRLRLCEQTEWCESSVEGLWWRRESGRRPNNDKASERRRSVRGLTF